MSDTTFDNVQEGGNTPNLTKEKVEIYNKFIEFSAIPTPERVDMLGIKKDPKTGKAERDPSLCAFAEKFGVHRNTLTAWKRLKHFKNAVESKQKEWGMDKVPNVLAALYNRCVKYGMAYDVETFLAYYSGWSRTQVIKTVGERFDEDDLRAMIAPLPKEEQDKFYATITEIITKSKVYRGDKEVEGHIPDDPTPDSGEV